MNKSIEINYWSFIEKYYPYYYHSDEIFLSNTTLVKIEKLEKSGKHKKKLKNLRVILLELDVKIFSKSLKNYFNQDENEY